MVGQDEPIPTLVSKLQHGERSLESFVNSHLDRIDRIDPTVRTLVDEPNRPDRVGDRVETLQAIEAVGEYPLFGIPIGIKDIIHVNGLPTEAGTALPSELFAGAEASVVSRLRDAGAIVIGKTVTTEFAGSAPGPTRNPFDTGHTPGGSSSGSAAGVAAGLFPAAIGTQTGGSVVRPAAFCGVVGFKPSFDRIPTDGVIPRSETLDHVGLFARSVNGVRRVARVACTEWQPTTDVGRPTLGIPDGPYLSRATSRARTAFRRNVGRLEDAGYEVVTVRLFTDFDATDRRREAVGAAELALNHAQWFDEYRPFYRTTSADRIERGQEVSIEELIAGRRVIADRRRVAADAMAEHGIDLWVAPAAPGPAPDTLATTGDSVMNRPWTDSGMPAATVPSGSIEGLPVGLQCIGRFGDDEYLLECLQEIAHAVRPDSFSYPEIH